VIGAEYLAGLGRERPRPDRIRRWPAAWRLAVATVCFGAFMGQLDVSIVTLTYRPVEQQFHVGLAGVEWVSLAYLLTLVTLLVPVGRLSDVHGRKLLYLYGLVVFTVASAACAVAPSLGVLVAFRVLQAAGAALLQANSVALVASSAPGSRLRGALGAQAAAQALGLALGPTVGGALVSSVGWRGVYLCNVPVGVVALVAGIYLLPRTHHHSRRLPADRIGAGLLALATTGLLLALSAASGLSLPEWGGALLGLGAVLSGGAFVAHQRRASHPLVDAALLADPVTSRGLLGALTGYLVLFGPLVVVPSVLTAQGASALRVGLVLTALPAGFAFGATIGGRLLPRGWSDRARATVGASVSGMALVAALLGPLTQGWLLAELAAVGLGLGTFTPSNNALIMGGIRPERSGTGGGLLNMTRALGTALGVALVTLALHLGGPSDHGARLALGVLAVAATVTAWTGWAGRQRRWISNADRRAARRRACATSSSTSAG
jgi:MFS family permease